VCSTTTCETEDIQQEQSTPRFLQSTGTRTAQCWNQDNTWQTTSCFAQYRACVLASNCAGRCEAAGENGPLVRRAGGFSGNTSRGAASSLLVPSSRFGARSRWDIFCLCDLFAISMGLPRRPQNREYSRSLRLV
jgi:hypothetical protein